MKDSAADSGRGGNTPTGTAGSGGAGGDIGATFDASPGGTGGAVDSAPASSDDAPLAPDGAEADAPSPDTASPPDAAVDAVAPEPDVAPPVDVAVDQPGLPASTLAMGLVGRWKLDEGTGKTTADSSENGNTGTLGGDTAWVKPGAPGPKFANPARLHFDGNNDYVELGIKNMPAVNAVKSVAFWFNGSNSGTTGSLAVSMSDATSGGSRLKLGYLAGQLVAARLGNHPLVTTAPPAAGWHHFVYTWDGTTNRLYLDGVEKNSSTMAPDTGKTANVRMGGNYDNSENYTGDLDDVRIYNRALSPAEVTALNAGQE